MMAKETGMGVCFGDFDYDCLTNLSFADDVLLFASTKEQLQKNFVRLQTKHRKGGTQDTSRKTNILGSPSSNSR